MKKSGTLPSIKQKESPIAVNKSKQTYRRLENKVNTHDEEITRNERVISNLANQFKMLKEQLQFEKQYSQKYKVVIQKYQEEAARFRKFIKDQKVHINKLEIIIMEKDRIIENKNKEIRIHQEKEEQYQKSIEDYQKMVGELHKTIDECNRNLKKCQQHIKELQSEKQALNLSIKEKNKQQKERQAAIIKEYESKIELKDEGIKTLQRQIKLLNSVVDNRRQNLVQKEKQMQKLVISTFNMQEKLQKMQKDEELKLKNYGQEMKLLSQLNQQMNTQLIQQQKTIQDLETAVKTLSTKNSAISGEKMKQFNLQKRDLIDKISQLQNKLDDFVKCKQAENDYNNKNEKQLKNLVLDMQKKLSKITASKEDISKQLIEQITQAANLLQKVATLLLPEQKQKSFQQ